ncbi:MAG: alpha/beta hydrolase [Pseudomonadota bacterium]
MLTKKWFWGLAALLVAGGAYAYFSGDSYEPADSRFTGAYRLADDSLAVLTPVDGNRFRLRHQQGGRVQLLLLGEDESFDVHDGFRASATPVTTGRFLRNAEGALEGFELASGERATRMALHEQVGHFPSGDLKLRGKLVLPAGKGPHPVVVTVHGSESYSAVDYYFMPYMLAANGIAGVAYDKRGTGESDGEYTQDFFALAKDTAAAAAWAAADDSVDEQRVNLMGFSQGGWIAPIAAADIPGITSLSIHFGVAVPVVREDRWGYVYELTKQGFGADVIEMADELNAALSRAVDDGDAAGWAQVSDLMDAHENSDWLQALAGSDSLLGRLAEPSTPVWGMRAYFWWNGGPSAPRTWDPASTIASLDIPQHWILAGEDSSAPTPESVAALERLRADGEPIDIRVFPDSEHGMVTYTQADDGERTSTGYAGTYFDEAIAWLKAHNGLVSDQ